MDTFMIGSDAWTSGREYGAEYAQRICGFIERIDQQAILDHASKLRENQPCTISQNYSVGNTNLVRKIKFEDGVEWAARFRMPPISDQNWVPSPRLEMQSELDSMELVRQKTDIQVPKVYGYNLDDDNAVGCPFSLIEYINGNTAEEVSKAYPGQHEGIPTQFEEKFWRQVAKIMIQLASVRMPKIGSVTRSNTDPNSFIVGPFVETGSGPYHSCAEFYEDYPIVLGKSLAKGRPSAVRGQEELIQTFRSLAKTFPRQTGEGFGLANLELNPNNILVDQEFNVLAVIDWDSVVAVPDAALYHLPFLMGIACIVPGDTNIHPKSLKRQKLGEQFAGVVEAVGREQSTKHTKERFHFSKTGFFSKESTALRSLVYVRMRQDTVNGEWLQGLRWLNEHSEAGLAEFYKHVLKGSYLSV